MYKHIKSFIYLPEMSPECRVIVHGNNVVDVAVYSDDCISLQILQHHVVNVVICKIIK